MAASMAVRRLSLAQGRVLARSGNGFEAVSCMQCRFKSIKKKTRNVLPVKIEKAALSEKFLQKRPLHSVYMVKDYPQQQLPFEECVNMHKEAAQPWMLDSLEGILYADIELDLTTKKQNKFMPDIRGVVVLPNKFDWGHKSIIAVITESEEDRKLAQELGAATVGDENFPKQVAQGLFDREDIRETDFFICTRKMSNAMNTVRNKLQSKTPAPKNNTVSSNVIELLKQYLDGVMYESGKISLSQGTVRVPIGRLTMDNKELEENFRALYLYLAKMKPSNLTPFVETATLVSPPCEEAFHVRLDEYLQQSGEKKKPDSTEEEKDDEDNA